MDNYWVEACAGSGKTTSLINHVLRLLFTKNDPQKIQIITFTNNACDEIVTRIEEILLKISKNKQFLHEKIIELDLNEIDEHHAQSLCAILNENPLNIDTIHGFCNKILNSKEKFSDHNLVNYIPKSIIFEFITKFIAENKEKIDENHVLTNNSFEYLCDLTNEIMQKNITINEEFQKNPPKYNKISEINAEELSEQDLKILNIIKLWINSNHNYQKYIKYREIFFTKNNILRKKRQKIENFKIKEFIENENIINLEEYFFEKHNYEILSFLNTIKEYYLQYKNDRKILDFADLIDYTNDFMQNSDTKDYIILKIDHILIDESQDNSPKQWEIVGLMLDLLLKFNEKSSFFVVGDPKQSIFSFQGSDLRYFFKKKNDIQEICLKYKKKIQFIDKNVSFRNSSIIIQLLNNLFKKSEILSIFKLKNIEFESKNQNNGKISLNFIKSSEKKPEFDQLHIDNNCIEIPKKEVRKYERLANYILNLIISLKKDKKLSNITILIQKKGDLFEKIKEKLHENGVDFQFSCNNIKDLAGIKDIINFAKIILNPLIDGAWIGFHESIFNVYNFETTHYKKNIWESLDSGFDELKSMIYDLFSLSKGSVYLFFLTIFNNFKDKFELDSQPFFNFLDIIIEFSAQQSPFLHDFLLFWDENKVINSKNTNLVSENTLKISTVHSAKGTENDIIILADAHEIPKLNINNLFQYKNNPALYQKDNYIFKKIYDKEKDNQYEEYLRLMYVAITRARNELHVFGMESNDQKYESWFNIIQKNLPENCTFNIL